MAGCRGHIWKGRLVVACQAGARRGEGGAGLWDLGGWCGLTRLAVRGCAPLCLRIAPLVCTGLDSTGLVWTGSDWTGPVWSLMPYCVV